MNEGKRTALIAVGIALVLAIAAIIVIAVWDGEPEAPAPPTASVEEAEERVGEQSGALPGGPSAPPPPTTPEHGPIARDYEILDETLQAARAARLDTAEIGNIIVALGRRFVGEPYVPGTLEVPGPEQLVVNLRVFDCVTYVESMLVLARMVRAGRSDMDAFRAELARLRYRNGVIDGYPSRLHYFSEWFADAERKGFVQDITRELGGVPIDEPINFMTSNAEAYPQLEDSANLEAMRDIERRLSAETRYFIPQDRIAQVAPMIRNGDIIAATSSIHGLDVAHTGIAIWIDGRLHLMHAPLVGKDVEISERPLAERILSIQGQDGIMVARPL